MDYRVLIVEASPLLRATARRAALQAGLAADRVRQVADGEQALAVLAEEPCDLVLLDVNSPAIDACQFLEAKAAMPALAHAKVVVVTAVANRKRLARLARLGVVHYLRKPFEPEELRALLCTLFEAEPVG